jgi:hypothetical protein
MFRFTRLRSLSVTGWLILLPNFTLLPDDRLVDTGIYVNFSLTQQWGFAAGYRFYDREISTSELTNRVAYDIPHLSANYTW